MRTILSMFFAVLNYTALILSGEFLYQEQYLIFTLLIVVAFAFKLAEYLAYHHEFKR
jgi:hypothetical protein